MLSVIVFAGGALLGAFLSATWGWDYERNERSANQERN
jgi:hypothetical protein